MASNLKEELDQNKLRLVYSEFTWTPQVGYLKHQNFNKEKALLSSHHTAEEHRVLEHRRTNSSKSYADVDNFNDAAFLWTHLYLLPIGHEFKTIFSRHGFALTKAPGPGRRVTGLRCGCRTQQNYRSTKGTSPGLGPCSNPVVLNTWSGDPWRVSESLSVGLPGQNYFHNK